MTILRQKTGLPEEGEIVLCTVLKVQHNSVFVKLNEYGDTGLIHISEVAPGRIRNLRDFVKEDKVIVCKVLRIIRDRGYIDLSLRRVTEIQRRGKINELKQEQIAEKILEMACKKHDLELPKVFAAIEKDVFSRYDTLFSVFFEATTNDKILAQVKIPKEIIPDLLEVIKTRIKPEHVEIGGKFSVMSYAPDGIELIKSAIIGAKKGLPEGSVKYMGGGKFQIRIGDSNYKSAEKTLKAFQDQLESGVNAFGGEFLFNRDDK